MNNENIELVGKISGSKLDALSEDKKGWILQLASEARLSDVAMVLKEEGIETSPAALSRFLKRDREKRLLEEGQDMNEGVAALAERGRDGALREGSLEAVRQRVYERVLVSNDPEEALKLYNAMLKEEGKLKELELEARKVAVAEEQVRLQAIKMAAEGRKRAGTVVEARTLEGVEELAGKMPAVPVSVPEVSERERKLVELVGDLEGILNGGGYSEEKVLAARLRLGERRLLGNTENDKIQGHPGVAGIKE